MCPFFFEVMNHLSHSLFSVFLAAVLLEMTSCSLFAPHTQVVHVYSEPSGASVRFEGRNYVTPFAMEVPRNRFFECEVRMDGYEKERLSSATTLSTTGILDLIGGCVILFPWLGFLSPGAMKLEKESWDIQLLPAAAGK